MSLTFLNISFLAESLFYGLVITITNADFPQRTLDLQIGSTILKKEITLRIILRILL